MQLGRLLTSRAAGAVGSSLYRAARDLPRHARRPAYRGATFKRHDSDMATLRGDTSIACPTRCENASCNTTCSSAGCRPRPGETTTGRWAAACRSQSPATTARRDRRGPRPPPQPAMTGNEPGGLPSVLRDRMENAGHADLIGSLLNPRGARVLEIRPRAGTILERLKRHDQADVQAMAIWQSQQFISGARPPRTPAGRPADAQ